MKDFQKKIQNPRDLIDKIKTLALRLFHPVPSHARTEVIFGKHKGRHGVIVGWYKGSYVVRLNSGVGARSLPRQAVKVL